MSESYAGSRCELPAHLPAFPNTRINSEFIPAGSFSAPGGGEYTVVDFCRVQAVSKPTADSNIRVELWLPAKGWSGRFYQVGSAGFAGNINYNGLVWQLERGNAVAATDNGHSAHRRDASWALGEPQKVIDYGYRALKVTRDISHALVAQFYQQAPERRYFAGCSNGGREALVMAQRYPGDWDGILVGAPAHNWTKIMAGFIWNVLALSETPDSNILPVKLPHIQRAALAACTESAQEIDGVATDPRHCPFEPADLRCENEEAEDCLIEAQVRALSKILKGPSKNLAAMPFYPSYEPSLAAHTWPADFGGWRGWLSNEDPLKTIQADYAMSFLRHMVFEDPEMMLGEHRFEAIVDAIQQKRVAGQRLSEVIDADRSDLSGFQAAGGKMLMYHGWGDYAISPQGVIDYYESVIKTGASEKATRDYFRLFMVPGMLHCGIGPGPNNFGQRSNGPNQAPENNIIKALEAWVEQGRVPEYLMATKYIEDDPQRGVQFTRRLCPYPDIAPQGSRGNEPQMCHNPNRGQ